MQVAESTLKQHDAALHEHEHKLNMLFGKLSVLEKDSDEWKIQQDGVSERLLKAETAPCFAALLVLHEELTNSTQG